MRQKAQQNSTTFASLASAWAADRRPYVKDSTYLNYTLTIRTRLNPRFGAQRTVEEGEVQQYLLSLLGAGLSRKTVRDTIALLKQILRWGAKRGLAAYTEWELQWPTHREPRRVPTLTPADHRRLIAYLTEHPLHYNTGILLALCTGMRIGEVCGLRWDDVDLTARTISVSRTMSRLYDCENRSETIRETTPKTRNSYRDIPITPTLMPALHAVRRASRSPYVVTGQITPSTEPHQLRDYFNRLLRRLGIPKIVFHGLRHTFATRCIEAGCDPKTVSSILGHSNVALTLNLYVHPDMEAKRRAALHMERAMRLNPKKQNA